MKKIIILTIFSLLLFSTAAEAKAIKKIIYSVKDSTEAIALSYQESAAQTFICQPGLGGVDLKLSGPASNNFIFKLKPVGAEEWYVQQHYQDISFANRVMYPLGFPLIEECGTEPWLFEIESLNTERPLVVHYHEQNPYPQGEMYRQDKVMAADLTFRLITDQPFMQQVKQNLKQELNLKLTQQKTFWMFYSLSLLIVGGSIVAVGKTKTLE